VVKRSFSILKCAGRHAAAWLRARTERVQILIAFIPSLRDAFNADDLPLSFILKRDSRASEPTRKRRDCPTSARGGRGTSLVYYTHRVERRADARSGLRANADSRSERHSLTTSD
jgi:hypothetical protein